MKYLVKRGDVYHFRAFFPDDLIQVGSPKEYTRSLRTTDYAEAIRKRNLMRVEFDHRVATERSRRDGRCTVLDDLMLDLEIALAQEVYRYELPEVDKARVEMTRLNRPGFTGGQNSRRIARYGTDIKEEDREPVPNQEVAA